MGRCDQDIVMLRHGFMWYGRAALSGNRDGIASAGRMARRCSVHADFTIALHTC